MDTMAGFFGFMKKQQDDAVPASTPGAPQQPIQQSAPQVVSQQTETTMSSGGSYNGIGTPSHGQSYNGIGSPPSGAQPYNGIGQPPSPQTVSQTPSSATVVKPPEKKEAPDKTGPPVSGTPGAVQPTPPETKGNTLTSNMNDKKRGDLDVMTHLTQRSNRVFLSANNKAKELHSAFLDSEHLLHGLLADGEIYKTLVDLKIQPQIIEQELEKLYKKENNQTAPQISPRIKRIIDNSLIVARKLGYEFISPEHILLAIYEEGEGVAARVLVKLGLKKEDLNKKVTGKKEGVVGADQKGTTERKTSVLEQFTVDLTAKAAQGELDPVVERSEVIERVIHILSRRSKNNPALVGEAGVGKTAIVEGLAQKIVSKQVPETLLNKKVLRLDLMSVLAGASHRGEFEERMKNLIEEVQNSKGAIILFIDEIHNIVGAGSSGEGSMDASNFLKPALSRGEIQLIGATTLTEYRKYIEKDPALERRFQPIVVPEPTEEQAIKMLKAIRNKYEAFHRVKIPDDVVDAAVKLSKRYIGDRFLPDKAVDLIDEACSAVRLPLISLPEEIKSLEERVAQLNQEIQEAEKKGDRVRARIIRSKEQDVEGELKEKKEQFTIKKAQTTTAVSIEIIKDIIARWTGIPVSKISGSEVEKLANLEKIMHERLIDQEVAVASVAQAVRRGRAGLKSNQRPIGSFVFLGPTGVGKTELAKTLADVLFGQEEAMIRFDMTEFMEKHEVAKLLGAPPGYIGYEEGGKLTEAVRRKPYSVVLFDEVEKAHPDIFNILLQILDDGRLTDNKGHTISFKNTVVIATSNIGTSIIQDELLKSGKAEVEEPPIVSTYTFSPRGREILTIGAKYFERDVKTSTLDAPKQEEKMDEKKKDTTTPPTDTKVEEKKDQKEDIVDWNKGMLLDYFAGQKVQAKDEKEAAEKKDKVTDFPIQGFETHAISSKGVESITKGSMMLSRTSTTAKVWDTINLIDYFKDHVVINALPDAPEEQLPTARFKTHAYTPDEMEIVTYKDRYWVRKEGANDWQTGMLKDYFIDQTIEKKTADSSEGFPTSHWDVHTFSPVGREIVIVGDSLWHREISGKVWKQTILKEYFGVNFPLEKEIDEKVKVEEETDRKKYDLIKDKVMNELRKFFRPELINRFDEVIIFEPLKFIHMIAIVKLQLKGLRKLLEEQEIGFAYTEAAVKAIVREGFDPIYGARPLRRAIQKLVENPISTLIIEGKVKSGDTILVDFDGESFIFNVERVELVSDKEGKNQSVKHFLCEECANKFQTETVPNSTPICSKCASPHIQEIAAEVLEKEMNGMDEKKIEPDVKDKPVEVSPKKEPKVDEKQPLTNGKASNGVVPNQPPVVTSSNGDTPVQNTQMSTGV
ncbi:MAG: AAA family ATPase [bacterium]|nr:AAA family ATPase [bacterium]